MTNAITNWISGILKPTAVAPPEQRSTQIGGIPVTADVLASLIGYGPTRSGVQINEQTALTYSAVYAAVLVLSQSVASLPLGVYEGDDQIEDRSPAINHPVYPLLRRRPNDEQTPFVFKETLQGHVTLWGNAYARIVTDNSGNAVDLLPMRPDHTSPERFAGELRYVDMRTGERFAPEEVLHIPGLTYNGIQGLSPIGLHREAVALGKATELFGASFFGNGANLGGVMSYDGTLKPEQAQQVREEWLRVQAGLSNAAKTAFLSGGWKYQSVGIPPEDAQFLQTRQFQIQDIARIFRVPPHMLGDLTKAGYASIEQQSLEFLLFTLTPWLEKWEQELTRKLLPAGGGLYVKFDERRLQRADLAAKQSYYTAAIDRGWYSPNDVRRDEGLAPIAEGDVYRFPVNYVDAKNAAKIGIDKPGRATSPSETPVPPESRSAIAMAVAVAANAMYLQHGNPTTAAAEAVRDLPPMVGEQARDDMAEVITRSLQRGQSAVGELRDAIIQHFGASNDSRN